MSDSSPVLDYRNSVSTPVFFPGLGYAAIALVNLVALIGPAVFVLFTRAVGDSYGPILGIFIGLPVMLGTLLLGTVPAVVYYINYRKEWPTTFQTMLLWLGLASFSSVTTIVALCLFMPRTHGSGC